MKHSSDTFCLAAAIILGGTVPVRADVKLPALFSDHMVVQAGSAVPVWGWAGPGEEVTVSFAARSKTTKGGADRRWTATFDPLRASDQPQLASYQLEGDKVRVHLKYAGGLRVRDGGIRGFALQDEAGRWDWAEAKADGPDLLLWSAHGSRPQALRYAWAENPFISIENGAGLPLRPFRIVLKREN